MPDFNPNDLESIPLWMWLFLFLMLGPPAAVWWSQKVRLVAVSSAAACRTARRMAHQRLRDWIKRIMQDPPDEQ
ncbi:hypothetical protein AB0N46_23270 [Streptomyces albidoflavus]|uniref:hypothetical protein n=1 Tax=Streptomyces albidoflavus TaxID=1886 RepID=UPI00341388F2